ncbi:MAG: DUF4168 domain-containing protein [Desulfobacteraceae bacterium]|jgi:hypothetical protein|nr:MAG: DUF4168 domain-containing protein [Desulfobacteraceae bacterium]
MNAKTVLRKMTNWKSLALVAAMVCLMTVPLTAQDYGGQQYQHEQQQSPPPQMNFNDEDLEKFANAQSDVADLRKQYSDALGQVEENEEAQALQETYTHRMIKAIEENGLSVEDYNNIVMAMQGDSELREKLNNMMN